MNETVRERLVRRSIPITESGCWIFDGCLDNKGYGQIGIGGRTWRAHRLSYSVFIGPIEDELEIDHVCRVRSCINPTHLEAVTPQTNCLRGVSSAAGYAARTHCTKGHPFDDENTYRRTDSPNARKCRMCEKQRSVARNRAKGMKVRLVTPKEERELYGKEKDDKCRK